jgi:transcriptional regulator with GAF, ATPase, and Fis domain
LTFEELSDNSHALLINGYSTEPIIKAIEQDICKNESISLKEFMDELEREIITLALLKANGSQCKAAKILGLRSTTLHEKIKRYDIELQKITVVKQNARYIPFHR